MIASEMGYVANEAKEFLKMNGDFVLSDDSHGVGQVGFGFRRTLAFAEGIGIKTLIVLQRGPTARDPRFPGVFGRPVLVNGLEKSHAFFQAQCTQRIAGHERLM